MVEETITVLVVTFLKREENQTVNDGVAHSHLTISDDPSIWLIPGAILVLQQNCPYLVTVDLDVEHIVDADRPGEHCVQVW